MKIAILGSGATGSAFGAYLMLGGAEDITLIDLYKEHMDAVRDNGLLFKDHNGERVVSGFKTAYTPTRSASSTYSSSSSRALTLRAPWPARSAASVRTPSSSLCRTASATISR